MNPTQQSHPSREPLADHLAGKLNAVDSDRVEQHLTGCDACCKVLNELPVDDTIVHSLRQQELDTSVSREDGNANQLTTSPEGAKATLPPQGEVTRVTGAVDSHLPLPNELHDHPRYRIVELLGRGGMGDVYRAEHKVMDRPVALKVIKPQLVQNDAAVRRFQREVQAAARLRHPNIVTAHDAEQAGDLHYLVMEFVDGDDLDEVIRRDGPLPVETACDYIRQAAEGLQHANDLGMVHRDIKPHNLMLERQSGTIGGESVVVKILDFGLANFANEVAEEVCSSRIHAVEEPDESGDDELPVGVSLLHQLTEMGTMMGTPDYIAPEQAQDAHTADIRSDIYSLGCTFYTLLTGKAPFGEGTVLDKIRAHSQQEAPPLSQCRDDVPPEVQAVLQKMLAKDPAQRYQSPAEVAEALAAIVRRDSDPVTTVATTASQSRRARRPIVLTAVATLFLALIAAAATIFYIQTDNGVVRVEVADDSLKVELDGKTITASDGDTTLRIRTGQQKLVVRRGDFEFETDSFQLRRGDEIALRVELLPGEVVVSKEDGTRLGAKRLPSSLSPNSDSDEPSEFFKFLVKYEPVVRQHVGGATCKMSEATSSCPGPGQFRFTAHITGPEGRARTVLGNLEHSLRGWVQKMEGRNTGGTSAEEDHGNSRTVRYEAHGRSGRVRVTMVRLTPDPAPEGDWEWRLEIEANEHQGSPLTIALVEGGEFRLSGQPVGSREFDRLLREAIADNPERVVDINVVKGTFGVSHVDMLEKIARNAGAKHVTRPAWAGASPVEPSKDEFRVVSQEWQRLAGRWRAVTWQSASRVLKPEDVANFELVVDAQQRTMTFDVHNDTPELTKADLEPSATPKRIDLRYNFGVKNQDAKTTLGIYKLEGDELTICLAYPGSSRPDEFKFVSKPGDRRQLFVLRRVKSAYHILTSDEYEWTEPVNLAALNSRSNEGAPWVSDDGLTMLFGSDRAPAWWWAIYQSTRKSTDAPWSKPVKLPVPINSERQEYNGNPSLTADGLTMVFTSERAGGVGGQDLWMVSRKSKDDPWEKLVNLRSLNSPQDDRYPALSADGRQLTYFTQRDGKNETLLTKRGSAAVPWSDPVLLPLESPWFGRYQLLDAGATVFQGGPGPRIEWWDSTARRWTKTDVELPGVTKFQYLSSFFHAPTNTLYMQARLPNGDQEADLWMSRRVKKKSVDPFALERRLEGHESPVRVTGFPDGSSDRLLSVEADGKVLEWDLVKGTNEERFDVGWSSDAVFSADGKWLAISVNSGDRKGEVAIWDVETGERRHTMQHGLDWTEVLRFSPDGKTLLAAGSPDVAVLWDVATGEERRRIDTEGGGTLSSGGFSADGRWLAVGKSRAMSLYDLQGDVHRQVELPQNRGQKAVVTAANGTRIAVLQSGGHITILDAATGEFLNEFRDGTEDDDSATSAAFVGNDRFLVTASEPGRITIREIETGRVVATTETDPGTYLTLTPSPDGRRLVTAGGLVWNEAKNKFEPNGDFALRLWQLPEGVWPEGLPLELSLEQTFKGHSGLGVSTASLATTPDGKLLISAGGKDKTARLWDTESGETLLVMPMENDGPVSVAITADGKLAAVRGTNGQIDLWDIGKKEKLRSLDQTEVRGGAMAFSADGKRLVTGALPAGDHKPISIVWDVGSGERLHVHRFPFDEPVGAVVAVPGTDDVIFTAKSYWRWNTVSGELAPLPDWPESLGGDLDISSDGALAAIVTNETVTLQPVRKRCSVQLRDLKTGRLVKTLETNDLELSQGPTPEMPVSICFVTGDAYVAVGYMHGEIRVFEIESGRLVAYKKDILPAPNLAPLSRGRIASTGLSLEREDNNIRVWQLPESVWPDKPKDQQMSAEHSIEELRLVNRIGGHLQLKSLAVLPNGRVLTAIGGTGSRLTVWNTKNGGGEVNIPIPFDAGTAAVSPDGRFVLVGASVHSADGFRVQLFDLENPSEARALSPDGIPTLEREPVWTLAQKLPPQELVFLRTGARLREEDWKFLVRDGEGKIQLHRTMSGEFVDTLVDQKVSCMALSAELMQLIVDVDGGPVKVVRTNKVAGPELPIQSMKCAAYSPRGTDRRRTEGDWIVTGDASGKIHVWDSRSGKKQRHWSAGDEEIVSLVFDVDGRRLFCATRHRITAWDFETARLLAAADMADFHVTHLALALDGRSLITGGRSWEDDQQPQADDHCLRLWQLPKSVWSNSGSNEPSATLSLERRLQGHHGAAHELSGLSASADGRRLLSAGGQLDKTAKLWDVETGRLLLTLKTRSEQSISAVALSPDGKLAALMSNRELDIWDVEAKKPLHEWSETNTRRLAFSPDGKRLVTLGHKAKIWNVETGEVIHEHVFSESSANDAKFVPGTSLVFLAAHNGWWSWDVETGRVLPGPGSRLSPPVTWSLDVSADGGKVAVATLRDTGTGKYSYTIEVRTRDQKLVAAVTLDHSANCVRFLPDDRYVISTNRLDRTIRIWDMAPPDSTAGREVARRVIPNNSWNVVVPLTAGRVATFGQSLSPNPILGEDAVLIWQLPESAWPTAKRQRR